MYLTAAVFNQDVRVIKAGQKFEFRDKNIIVGDQGCGKSTLLQHLGMPDNRSKVSLFLSAAGQKGVRTFYFDTEHDNPRLKNPLDYYTPMGESRGIGAGNAIRSRRQSHGEVLVEFTVNALRKARDCVIFLDEPESGLSLRNQYKLTKEVDAAVKRKCQLFVATHCLPLIQAADMVLSLEHNKWLQADEFIATQKSNKKG